MKQTNEAELWNTCNCVIVLVYSEGKQAIYVKLTSESKFVNYMFGLVV